MWDSVERPIDCRHNGASTALRFLPFALSLLILLHSVAALVPPPAQTLSCRGCCMSRKGLNRMGNRLTPSPLIVAHYVSLTTVLSCSPYAEKVFK